MRNVFVSVLCVLGLVVVLSSNVLASDLSACNFYCQLANWMTNMNNRVTALEHTPMVTEVVNNYHGGGKSDASIVRAVNKSQYFATNDYVDHVLAECRFGKNFTALQLGAVVVERTHQSYYGDGFSILVR